MQNRTILEGPYGLNQHQGLSIDSKIYMHLKLKIEVLHMAERLAAYKYSYLIGVHGLQFYGRNHLYKDSIQLELHLRLFYNILLAAS